MYYKDLISQIPIKTPLLICLYGELGAGKTTFAKEFISTLTSIKQDEITSPTFGIMNTYDYNNHKIWHYDLYRIKNKNELYELNLKEALQDIVIIEWPQIAEDLLPKTRINIEFFISYSQKNSNEVRSFFLKNTY